MHFHKFNEKFLNKILISEIYMSDNVKDKHKLQVYLMRL